MRQSDEADAAKTPAPAILPTSWRKKTRATRTSDKALGLNKPIDTACLRQSAVPTMVLLSSHRHRNGGSPRRTRGSYGSIREERRCGAMTPKSKAVWDYARSQQEGVFRGQVINTEH